MSSPILEFIQAARDSFIGAEHVYTNGSCYYFAKMLKTVFPEGALYENHSHVVFKYKNRFYDIRGEIHPDHDLELAREPTRHGKYSLINDYPRLGKNQ